MCFRSYSSRWRLWIVWVTELKLETQPTQRHMESYTHLQLNTLKAKMLQTLNSDPGFWWVVITACDPSCLENTFVVLINQMLAVSQTFSMFFLIFESEALITGKKRRRKKIGQFSKNTVLNYFMLAWVRSVWRPVSAQIIHHCKQIISVNIL